jgi:hypothetical protein
MVLSENRRTSMIRIATFLAAAAIAASSLTSSASAQSFTADAGTGNVQDTHFKADGTLVQDYIYAPQNKAIAADRRLSAFAAAPATGVRRDANAVGVPSGSAGYNELLATH